MFKQVGMGKEAVENIVHEEIEYLFAQITQEQESSTNGTANIEKLIGSSASNIVSLIVTGDRYDFDHPTRKMLDKMFLQRDDQELGRTLGVVNYLTWFVRFLISLPFGSQRQLINNFTEVKKYLRNRVKYCKESFDPEREEAVNFIQAYQKEMRHVSSRFFDDEHVYLCSMAFFGAGNATTKDFIGWCLQSLVVYTGIQEKMRTEIDVVVGKDRKISMKDKANLPYCEAFFAEVERMSSAVPLALIHEIAQDTQLDSYSLPKGTHFILNTFAIHYSPEYFPEPKIFKPERFLSKDGKKFVRDDNLMGFGTGKRSCPGEPLAKTEVFLYITTCIQKFMLIPSQDQVTLGGKIDSLSRVPKNGVQCIFQLRQ
jgi:cytochrome P450